MELPLLYSDWEQGAARGPVSSTAHHQKVPHWVKLNHSPLADHHCFPYFGKLHWMRKLLPTCPRCLAPMCSQGHLWGPPSLKQVSHSPSGSPSSTPRVLGRFPDAGSIPPALAESSSSSRHPAAGAQGGPQCSQHSAPHGSQPSWPSTLMAESSYSLLLWVTGDQPDTEKPCPCQIPISSSAGPQNMWRGKVWAKSWKERPEAGTGGLPGTQSSPFWQMMSGHGKNIQVSPCQTSGDSWPSYTAPHMGCYCPTMDWRGC